MESFEYRGVWWTPEDPETQVVGSLSFSPRTGSKLKLFGVFNRTPRQVPEFCPIILGVIESGKPVTLQSGTRISYVFNTLGIHTSDYDVGTAFIGLHAEVKEQLKFVKAQAKFTYLFEWVGLSGISHNFLTQDEKPHLTSSYLIPEEISISTDEGVIKFSSAVEVKAKRDLSTIKESIFVEIERNEESNLFGIFRDFLSPVRQIIDLGTNNTNFVEELILFHKDNLDEKITTYYNQRFYQPRSKDLPQHEMMFVLGNIYENFEERFRNWIAISKEIDSVLNLFRRAIISSDLFLELKFLTLAQAIETYHRRRREGYILPRNEQKLRIKEIIDNVPGCHKEWLKNALAFSNEKSLKIRLEELMSESNTIMKPMIKDYTEFVKKVRNTRNYLTHYDKHGESKAAKGAELHWLTEKLLILLKSCLLCEFGINKEDQIKLFRSYEKYNYIVGQNVNS